jgi:hypothetical protein
MSGSDFQPYNANSWFKLLQFSVAANQRCLPSEWVTTMTLLMVGYVSLAKTNEIQPNNR